MADGGAASWTATDGQGKWCWVQGLPQVEGLGFGNWVWSALRVQGLEPGQGARFQDLNVSCPT